MKVIEQNELLGTYINNLCYLYSKSKYHTVIYNTKKLIVIYQNSHALFNILGMSCAKIYKYSDALDNFKKALELYPNNPLTHFNLGNVYHDKNQLELAIVHYKEALKINPKYIEVLFNLYFVLNEKSDHKSAYQILKKINEINHKNYDMIPKIISSAKFNRLEEYKKLFNSFCELLNKEDKRLEFSNYKKNQPITALIGFGRSGSLFCHSLFDGHPQISTLPGYFFKGWFNNQTWGLLKPNYNDINWKENLAKKIIDLYEPQFNSNSKKNVLGKPNGENMWLAKSLGFTQLGESKQEVLKLNQKKFEDNFTYLLKPLKKIDTNICFQLIHTAFDISYRKPQGIKKNNKVIFYHIHNPDEYEFANFVRNFPDAKILYLIRNPLQMIESWIASDLEKLKGSLDDKKSIQLCERILGKIYYPFEFLNNPFNSIVNNQIRGIKLEDIKRNPNKVIPLISNWIGIRNDNSLYKSEFMGQKYSRPSPSFGRMSGFDHSAIDIKIGRFFGKTDIKILETLMWPFLNTYKYNNVSFSEFKINLRETKKLLDQPMKFENVLKNCLNNRKLNICNSVNNFRKCLFDIHNELSINLSYPHMIKPLIEKKI